MLDLGRSAKWDKRYCMCLALGLGPEDRQMCVVGSAEVVVTRAAAGRVRATRRGCSCLGSWTKVALVDIRVRLLIRVGS